MDKHKISKRNLTDIVITSGIGLGMLAGTLEVTKVVHSLTEKTSSLIGSVGSSIVEYGVSGIVCGGGLYLTTITIIAADNYLTNRS